MADQDIAYILKGYPRLSETFILNEIRLLESMGLRLRIYSLKRETEAKVHAVVSQIQAPVTFMPEDDSAVGAEFRHWLRANLPRYAPSHFRLIGRHPMRYLRSLTFAILRVSLCIPRRLPLFRRAPIRDFVRAGAIADAVLEAGTVRHLHAHFCHGSTTMAMLASRLTGIPYSFTAHAKDIYVDKLNPDGLLVRKIEGAAFVVTCTDTNRRHLTRISPGSPITTVYHGLDTGRFEPPLTPRPNGDAAVILSVGRLVPKKGFLSLVRACAILRDRGLTFRCRIVGQPGEDSARVADLVDELGLDGVVAIEGGMTQAELRTAYGSCTVFALACEVASDGDRDGIPNVLVEAMAMETPVVASRLSGIPELVDDNVNGLLVAPRDPRVLADAIQQLLAHHELRARLGTAARGTVEDRFDSSRTTEDLHRLFAETLKATVHRVTGEETGILSKAGVR